MEHSPMPNVAADQLKTQMQNTKALLTTAHGQPIGQKLASLTAGERGPILIGDQYYLDEMAHFDRERAPERVVHAKGGGAFGHFEVTHDITKYTKAVIFDKIGKQTPMAARFSTVAGESGSADTVRDPRGFALKFYTEHGIWDLVCNNTPIFFIRDPIHFPSFIHTQKRNPVTHLKDANMFWDFSSLRHESCHQMAILFSDRGTPDGFRHMHGFGGHAFKLVNAQGEITFAKFHFLTDQGIKNLPAEKAAELVGTNPDYAIQDLFNAIASGHFPSWTLHIQVMTQAQADTVPYNPFDITKVWPHADFPLMPVGRFILNRNPTNYFAEVESIAFSPAHLIPGIEASADKMLQGRLFSYGDTQRHRLGTNYLQLPVNCPFMVANYQRDGPMAVTDNHRGLPNYYPNSFSGPEQDAVHDDTPYSIVGVARRYDTTNDDNYTQCRNFWQKVLKEDERQRLVRNLAGHLTNAAPFIQKRVVDMFSKVDPAFGQGIQDELEHPNKKASAKV